MPDMVAKAGHKRKICVVTGSRAEYGLLSNLIGEIGRDPELDLAVIVTGMHLAPEFGLTYREIEKDGFEIAEKIDIHLGEDTPAGIAESMGAGIAGFAGAFSRVRPDIIVLLGDRFEIIAAALAALPARIPVAHIHGGETTEGAFDESIRHAITKMSHLHFTANEVYSRRVIQMGESPARVFNFGAPGLDVIARMEFLDREAFAGAVGMDIGDTLFLVTYHPETLGGRDQRRVLDELFAALDRFPEASVIITMPNADTGGKGLAGMFESYAGKRKRVTTFKSLGIAMYLNAVKHSAVVIGNSSSGLSEAPALRTPTVNIGDRQKGRLRAASVLDCPPEAGFIEEAIRKALSPEFREKLPGVRNPYGDGNASVKIKNTLKTFPLERITVKTFYDLPDRRE